MDQTQKTRFIDREGVTFVMFGILPFVGGLALSIVEQQIFNWKSIVLLGIAFVCSLWANYFSWNAHAREISDWDLIYAFLSKTSPLLTRVYEWVWATVGLVIIPPVMGSLCMHLVADMTIANSYAFSQLAWGAGSYGMLFLLLYVHKRLRGEQ